VLKRCVWRERLSSSSAMGRFNWSCPSVTTWNCTRISPRSLVPVMSALKILWPWYCDKCFASL
jgi:hypothetical protein